MNNFTKILGLGLMSIAAAIPLTTQAADLGDPEINPLPNHLKFNNEDTKYMAGEIQEIVLTWPGTELELNTGKSFKISNWTDWENVNLYDYAFVNGDQLIIKYPLTLAATYDFYAAAGVVTDKKTGNTSPSISLVYEISALAIESDWFAGSPALNPGSIVELGPEINLTLPGYSITSIDPSKFWYSKVAYNSIFDINPQEFDYGEAQFDNLVQAKSAELVNGAIKVDLGTTFTAPGLYVVKINSDAIVCSNATKDNITVENYQLLIYRVQGYSLSPQPGSTITGEFQGLSIYGPNVAVSSVSSIKIYRGYLDESTTDAERNKLTPVAVGESAMPTETNDGQTVYFNFTGEPLYNGVYTMYIPTGTIKVNGQNMMTYENKPYNYYSFTISDQLAKVPAVGSNPSPGLVTAIPDQIKVIWGTGDQPSSGNTASASYYGCILEKTGTGSPTLTLPDGKNASIIVGVNNSIESGDLETPVILGSYLAVQTDYYTAPGKYTLNIPAGYVNIIIDQYNTVPNDAVSLVYVIGGATLSEAEQLTEVISLGDPMASVDITWNEDVAFVDEANASVSVSFNNENIGDLTAEYLNLVPAGSNEPGIAALADEGDVLHILLGASGLVEQPGTYTISVPARLVVSQNGAFNPAQTLTVTVEEAQFAIGVISPASGFEFKQSENVSFKITFEGAEEVTENLTEDAPLLVTDYSEYDKIFTWSDDVLSIDGNAVNINLGNNLEPATYYLTFRGGQVLVDGYENEGIEDYTFVVVKTETDGVSSIISDEDGAVIYNLQGVRVSNPQKGNIYIINGKKAILR